MVKEKILHYLYNKLKLLQWKYGLLFSQKEYLYNLNGNRLFPEENNKILILVPHSDDEWIGCSKIISSHKKVDVYYFNFLGKNYTENNKIIRLNELQALKKIFSFNLFISGSYDSYEDLKALLLKNKYTHIFIPSFFDWHPEHIKVNKIFNTCINDINLDVFPQLFFYPITVPLPDQLNIFYSVMDKAYIKLKKNTFNLIYKSQKNIPCRRSCIQSRISAKGLKYHAIETYGKISLVNWNKIMLFIEDHQQHIASLFIQNIDHLISIRKISNSIYNEFLNNKD